MRTHRPTETTRGTLARRLLIALALALVMTLAAAGTALAASGHAAAQQVRTPAADQPAADESNSSPMVPLVFAGILLLAVASPALPRYSRYGYYRGERW